MSKKSKSKKIEILEIEGGQNIMVFESSDHTQFVYDAERFPPTRHFTAKIQLSVGGEPGAMVYDKKRNLNLVIPRKWGEEIFESFGLVKSKVSFPANVKGYFECSIDKEGRLNVHAYQRPTANCKMVKENRND